MVINYNKLSESDQAKVNETINKSRAEHPQVWGYRNEGGNWVFTAVTHHNDGTRLRRGGWLPVTF